jgi:hypothetical protein
MGFFLIFKGFCLTKEKELKYELPFLAKFICQLQKKRLLGSGVTHYATQ